MLAMAVLRRPGLLLSAAATITVPSVLAILAVLGHDHAASEPLAEAVPPGGSASRAALSAEPLSAAPPSVAAPASSVAFRNAVAEKEKRELASMRAEAFGDAVSAQPGLGMTLLGKSAVAGIAASYQGVELIAQWGVAGTVTMISNVWHRGGLTVTQTSDAEMSVGGQPYVSYDVGNHSPEGVFGVTKALVALLDRHYVAVYRGTGAAVGRPALIVDLRRANGSLAARFWLDRRTMVPLRREVYDTSAQLVSEDSFVQVQFGALAPLPAVAGAGRSSAGSGWATVTAPGQLIASLNGQGWQLPATLPGGLPLYAAARCRTGAGEVVGLGYSDGLSVVSLFVQRGTLVPKAAGWQQVSLRGHQVYVAGHSIIWAGRGFVYTMIADAPPHTVTQVIAALPQNTAPGFLGRISRGLGRLAALVNPFG